MPTKKKAPNVSESSHSVEGAKADKPKHAGGRPTKYDPAYCQQSIDYMADGYSATAFAGHINVSFSTLKLWMEEHPEFSAAIKVARSKSAAWWEEALRNNALTGDGSATACIFGVKNRSQDEWKDKIEMDSKQSITINIGGKFAEL